MALGGALGMYNEPNEKFINDTIFLVSEFKEPELVMLKVIVGGGMRINKSKEYTLVGVETKDIPCIDFIETYLESLNYKFLKFETYSDYNKYVSAISNQ